MTLTADPEATTASRPDVSTARITGLLYLGVGITGVLGFLVVRTRLFEPDDPASTLARLVEHQTLARVGIGLELALVVFQVLAALWFYRLFRHVDAFAAGAIAVFGTVNAVAIMVSAAFLATALDVAVQPLGVETSQLMYLLSENTWAAGNLFFGLWLIPMGLATLRSGWAPRTLGWFLVVGGVGYLLMAFLAPLVPSLGPAVEALVIPATVGELWMIGWLLSRTAGTSRRPGRGSAPDRAERPRSDRPGRVRET